MVSPSRMIAPTVMRGLREETGSWKMICISRLNARSSDVPIELTSRPSNLISPDVGSMRRRIVRPVVVLPHPDSPTTPRVSPRAACTAPTWRENTPFLMGKDFLRWLTESSGTAPFMRPLLLLPPRAACGDCYVAPARSRGDSATRGWRRPDRATDARARTDPTNKESGRGTDRPFG